MRRAFAAAAIILPAVLTLGGCARPPQLVMVNPHTGATVDCEAPRPGASSGEFLISRACLSACGAHGFQLLPGVQAKDSGGDFPRACEN
jgi:hypothetical protein